MFQALRGVVQDGTATTPLVQDITVAEAEYGRFEVAVVHANGQPFDLTGYRPVMTARSTEDTFDPPALFVREGTIVSAVFGLVLFEIGRDDTAGKYGTYFYDVVLVLIADPTIVLPVVPESTFIVEDAAYSPNDTPTPSPF